MMLCLLGGRGGEERVLLPRLLQKCQKKVSLSFPSCMCDMHLRVDVGVPDALVQQLPHGALEARADLLRLV